jgi:hypothetical protein
VFLFDLYRATVIFEYVLQRLADIWGRYLQYFQCIEIFGRAHCTFPSELPGRRPLPLPNQAGLARYRSNLFFRQRRCLAGCPDSGGRGAVRGAGGAGGASPPSQADCEVPDPDSAPRRWWIRPHPVRGPAHQGPDCQGHHRPPHLLLPCLSLYRLHPHPRLL